MYLICLAIYIIKGLQPLKDKLGKTSEDIKKFKFIEKEKNNEDKNNLHLMTNNLKIYKKRKSINSYNSNPIIVSYNSIIKGHNKKLVNFQKNIKIIKIIMKFLNQIIKRIKMIIKKYHLT